MEPIFEEAPETTEKYENLDEALDGADAVEGGPEGRRDIDEDLVADNEELEQSGADLRDPDQISLLEGFADDPDGTGPPGAPLEEHEAETETVEAESDTVEVVEPLDLDLSESTPRV